MTARGLVIAAPASGSGKTTLTLGLLRCFRNQGLTVSGVKVGPDYIDPAFHAAASGRICRNIDLWAMRPDTVASVLVDNDCHLVIAEGVMGLFDGASGMSGSFDGNGSTADIAEALGWPVLLVIDAKAQAASAAATLHGFATFDPRLTIAAVIFNRVSSPSHAQAIRDACQGLDIPIAGFLPKDPTLIVPDRHLGLVQAQEHGDLEAFLDSAARHIADHLDIGLIKSLAEPTQTDLSTTSGATSPIVPLGQVIAVARDQAFAFTYPHILDNWRRCGAEIRFFSPMSNEPVPGDASGVFLPGGYPELHGSAIAAANRFLDSLRAAATQGTAIYGECGGYMVLGKGLIDSNGVSHAMAGLLPVETSFAKPRLHLGYRSAKTRNDSALGPAGLRFRGHEFHYAQVAGPCLAPALFQCADSRGHDLGEYGCVIGTVAGSFLHLIDQAG